MNGILIQALFFLSDLSLGNAGITSVTAGAMGISIGSDGLDGELDNSGSITAMATASNLGTSAIAAAVGVFTTPTGTSSGTITNSGVISALASANASSTASAFAAGVMTLSLATSTSKGEMEEWFSSSWGFAKQITPLLFYGVLVAGLLLGRPQQEGLIPSQWVSSLVGNNSLFANFFASVVGAFMYFATLTEVPILEGMIGNGMEQGPALALLLAGPALSLPNMLVIQSVMGTKKTVVFVILVIIMATTTGILYGSLFG